MAVNPKTIRDGGKSPIRPKKICLWRMTLDTIIEFMTPYGALNGGR